MILLEVYWELVDNYGFDPDWFNVYPEDTETLSNTYLDLKTGRRLPRTTRLGNKAKSINNNSNNKKHRGDREKGLHGNQLALQLVVDGLKLQPCYPTFVSARDAILQADVSGFGGAHICDIWRAFAKRGLGFGARAGGRESFTVPRKCRDPAKKKDDAEKEKKQQDEDVFFNDL